MKDKLDLVAYRSGRLVPYDQALAEMSGDESGSTGGIYDAERTFSGRVFKLRDHLQRLYRSLESAEVDPGMSIDEMEARTLEVLEANRPVLASGDDFILGQVASLRTAFASDGPGGADVFIYCQFIDFPNFAHGYMRGVRLVSPATYAVPQQYSPDGDEGAGQRTFSLMDDPEGNFTDCRRANLLFVSDGRIKLPQRQKVLPGISMETVLELAESVGIPMDEGDYCAYDIYEADEAFVTGTRYCLLPVATFNGLTLGEDLPGPVTRSLLAAWSERVEMDFVQQALSHLPAEQRERSSYAR